MSLRLLKERGYIHFKNALSVPQIKAVQTDAKKVFFTQMREIGITPNGIDDETEFSRCMFEFFKKDESRFVRAGRLCQHLVSLHRLSLSDEILKIVRDAGVEFPTVSTRPVMFFNSKHLAKSQGYWKAPAHQDWRSIQGSLNSVVIWVPLLSIDKSLGALEVVPGSHCDGLMSTTEDDFYRAIDDERYTDESFVPVETTIGDCLLFSTFLVHRSGTNSTNRVRWSCHFRFNDMLEKTFIEREFPNPYIYKPQQELITPNFPHQNLLVSLFKNEIS